MSQSAETVNNYRLFITRAGSQNVFILVAERPKLCYTR